MSTRHDSGPIAWMTRHGVAPNILMLVLLVGGLLMTTQIRQEVFPDFSEDAVTITVPLPGASPEEVEESVILAIEEELRSVEGVDEIRSTARESVGTVVVDIMAGQDRNRVFQDVQQAVSRVTTFPDDAEAAIVALNSRKRPVLDVLLYGDMDEWGLRNAAEELRDALLQDANITEVELRGARELEIHVEIPEARLREHGLTLGQVATVLRQSALDRGGGTIETSSGDILLRVQERREAAFEFADIPIITGRDGALVRLGDIATIAEGFEDSNTAATFNGKRAIALDVFRVGDQTPISVSEAFHARAPEAMAALPPGLELAVQEDRSLIFKQRLNLLLKNGAIGLALVLLILSLFLEFKLAMWVATGIATAFAGTLLLLPATGTTINMVSLFAFILALGIVVDDAIVTGENIYEYRQRGMGYIEAAARGARDIALPVSFSILTNIVAFWPLMTVPGGFGKIWAVIPVVVVLAFIISWVEALFILPSHLAHVKDSHGRLHRMQQAFSAGFDRLVRGVYGPFLRAAIRWRYLTIACMIAILAAVVSLPASGRMGFILMPQVESDFSQATATLPVGAPMAAAEAVRDRLVTAAERVVAETGGDELARGVYALIRSNVVEVRIYLHPAGTRWRDMSTTEVTRLWRGAVGGEIAGLESLRFAADAGGPGRGPQVSVELSHRNLVTLERATEALARELEAFASVSDVDDGFEAGKVQLDFRVTEEARSLGLDAAAIAAQVRARFYGAEAIKQQRGRNEVTLKVRLPASERSSLADVERMILITPDGGEVPLYQVARVVPGRADTAIVRRDARRVVTATANVEPVAETGRVLAALTEEILPRLTADMPGLSYSFEGRQATMRDAMNAFFRSAGISLLVIYVLLAIPFRSYLQPLIVMTAIPFGFVGAVLGHQIMGYSLSIISIMGIIALSGVVINGALVMIDYANTCRGEGQDPEQAIWSAGLRRFRPILLTTLTTFGGLAPMIFETSRQARFLIPMALSLGYGIVFATAIVLVLIPSLYMMMEDIKGLGRKAAAQVIPLRPATGSAPEALAEEATPRRLDAAE